MSKERIEKIADSFDLGFSDFFHGENVRELTLQEKLATIEQTREFMIIDECMNFSIFNKRGQEHPAAEIYALDFPSDFRASVYLLLGGYYRQSILCLRNWLEVRLTGIYFSFVDPDKSLYEDWKKGVKRAPITKGLIKRLFGRSEFHKIDSKVGFRGRLESLMSELPAFTHCSILEKYDLKSETDNVPRFNPQSVDLWFDFALRTFTEIVFCCFLAYGKDAFGMNSEEMETIRRYLPAAYQEEFHMSGIL